MKKLLLLLLLTGWFAGANATIRYVKPTATGNGLGDSWVNASADIQAMINASASGDEVWVAGGTYKPNRRADATGTITEGDRANAFVLKANVKLYGSFAGWEGVLAHRGDYLDAGKRTILTGDFNGDDGANFINNTENAYHLVMIVGAGSSGAAEINGFTITGANSNGPSTVTIDGQRVNNAGGGIICYGSSPRIANVCFIRNTAALGGGLFIDGISSPALANCTFAENVVSVNGGAVTNLGGYYVSFLNCLFVSNKATATFGSAGAVLIGPSNFTNCTFFNNMAARGAAISLFGSPVTLTNCILWQNTSTENTEIAFGTGTLNMAYCIRADSIAGPGNVYINPKFQNTDNPAGWDGVYGTLDDGLRPGVCGSYAINTGSNTAIDGTATDIMGYPRIYETTVDRGAYEYQFPLYEPVLGGKLYVKEGGTGSGQSWNCATGDLSAALAAVESGQQVWVAKGTYKPSRRADAQGAVSTGDRNNTFLIKSDVKLYGGFAGWETTLDERTTATIAANPTILSGDLAGDDGDDFANNGENTYHVVLSAGEVGTARLDGFIIKGGNANGNLAAPDTYINGKPIIVYSGGGMQLSASSPTISNCIFMGNSGNSGGGLYNHTSSSPTISNCLFEANRAARGAGMSNEGNNISPEVRNCVFTNNKGIGINSIGGGVSNLGNGSPSFTNCIISHNIATFGGGIAFQNGAAVKLINTTITKNAVTRWGGGIYFDTDATPVTVTNCILWNNTATVESPGIFSYNTMPGITYSNIQGGYTGTANSNVDPLFENINSPAGADNIYGTADDGLRLVGCSPLIDMGNSAAIGSITIDIAGSDRSYNSATVDMGAYEYQNAPPNLAITAQGTTNICANGSVVLQGNTGGTWSNGQTTPTITVTTAGTYSVSYACPTGNLTSEAIGVTVKPTLPTATIGGTATICQSQAPANITFTGAGSMGPYTFTYNVNGIGTQSISTAGTRYVRINQNKTGQFDNLTIAEVQVLEAGTGVNLAAGKPVTMSSVYQGFVGANLTDGILTNYAHTLVGGNGAFMEIDLGGDYNIGSVNIYNRHDCCREAIENVQLVLKETSGYGQYSATINPFLFRDANQLSNWPITSLTKALAVTNNGSNVYNLLTVSAGGCSQAQPGAALLDIVANQSAPTGNASQFFCTNTNPTVANLSATGAGILWYASANGGTALAGNTALINGTHYYASQTTNGCESTARLNVTVIVNATVAPVGNASHFFCSIASPTVASLSATGEGIVWYAAASGGTALASTTALVNGNHYFASQTANGCESINRLDVMATVSTTPAPLGNSTQYFCSATNPMVTNLTATGTDILWYTKASGGTVVANTSALPIGTTHYYASQITGNCESVNRLDVTAIVNASPETPDGSIVQSFCGMASPTVADMSATGTGIVWYLTTSGGIALATNTALANGTRYYATQTANGCESANRLEVTATVNTPAAPIGSPAQGFCSAINPTVANLSAMGTGILWYADANGGMALAANTALVNGRHYHASQTSHDCESISRLEVVATTNATPLPPWGGVQYLCSHINPTVADLTSIGSNIKWYAQPNGGTPLFSTSPVVFERQYFASQTLNGCESERSTLHLFSKPSPSASISGGTSVCLGSTSPEITFTGLGSEAPFTFIYSINGGGSQSISNLANTYAATLQVPTGTAGTYSYELLSASSANGCQREIGSTVIVKVVAPPILTASTVTDSICLGGSSTVSAIVSPAPAAGNALLLNGQTDYVAFGSGTQLQLPLDNSAYTIEAWINPTQLGDYGIAGWGNYGVYSGVNALRLSSTGIVNYWWDNDLQVEAPVLVNQWNHIAATFDGITRSIYLNGTLLQTLSSAFLHQITTGANFTIGRTNSTEYFPGQIDEVRIWNVARTQAQIQAGMSSSVPISSAGLKAYFKCNEAYGTTAVTNSNNTVASGYLSNGNARAIATAPMVDAVITWQPGHMVGATVPVSPLENTVYTATYSNEIGCTVTGSTALNLFAPSASTATISVSAAAVCVGGASPVVTITGAGGTAPYTFVYTVGGGQPVTVSSNSGNTVTVEVPTDYEGYFEYRLVSVSAQGDGCTKFLSDAVDVTVYGRPYYASIKAGGPASFCQGGSITLAANVEQSAYLWQPGGATTPSITATTSGSYTLTVTNSFGCHFTTAPFVVTSMLPDIYVDSSVAISGDGSSWAKAYKELREIVNLRPSCTNIHIAKGTYKPTAGSDRSAFFFLRYDNLRLLGGYPSGGGTRNPTANPVYLDGDIGNPNDSTDNSWHIMAIEAAGTDSLVLDGLTFRNGNANGTGFTNFIDSRISNGSGASLVIRGYDPEPTAKWVIRHCNFISNTARNTGAGPYIILAHPSFSHCRFIANTAVSGSGAYSFNSNAVFSQCSFTGNKASNSGGGLLVNSGTPSINQCRFSSNRALSGGGLQVQSSNCAISNSIFTGNSAVNGTSGQGGGGLFNDGGDISIYNSSFAGNNAGEGGALNGNNDGFTKLYNSIIWGNSPAYESSSSSYGFNHCIIQGGHTGAGNIDADPLFINAPSYTTAPFGDGDYRLQACSPAINAGENSSVITESAIDYAGLARIQGTGVDMGAYEFKGLNNGNPVGGDLLARDGDAGTSSVIGKTSLMVTNSTCAMVATITPNGAYPVTGSVTAKVFIDPFVQFHPYNGQSLPYLQRHYDIAPAANASTATARLTLYYTQAEFDAYNAEVMEDAWTLPLNSTDNIGKRRLRILQYHGSSSDGTGSPGSYTGNAKLIDPGVDNIVWDNALQRWEITFDINGFSGFFLGVDPLIILPVKLVSFTGLLTSGQKAASLQWQVAGQLGTQKYVIERSMDGNIYQSVGNVAANQLGSATYTYEDILPPAAPSFTAYYRLKIIGTDGAVSYSQIVRLGSGGVTGGKIVLYPNPVSKGVLLQISISNGVLRQYKLTAATGQVLLRKTGLNLTGTTSLQLPNALAAGVYYLQLHSDKGVHTERLIVK